MKVLIARFACDESGATAVEYGLIAAAMSAAIITMMLGLGSKLTATFASVPVGLKWADAPRRFSPCGGNDQSDAAGAILLRVAV
jgi:pilus assembly protein Flp/PilA